MIYLMACEEMGVCKIGFSKDPERRLAEVQTGCPYNVRLASVREGCSALEREIHNRLQFYRTVGEWFRLEDGVIQAFQSISIAEKKVTKHQGAVGTLDHYLSRDDAPSMTAFAAKLGVTKARLSQLRHSTDWPAELALAAERQSGGALNASDISAVVKLARKTAA